MVTHDISNLTQAVKANPTDITARLALADAYEEQGNDSAATEQRTLANLTVDDRRAALADWLDEGGDTFDQITEDYKTNLFTVGDGDRRFLVLTEDEADKLCAEQILDSIWAFNADFIVSHMSLNGSERDAERSIRAVQERCSEDCNGLLRAALNDEDEFVSDAISADGRGHFLSSYDGEEHEVTYNRATLLIYRD